MAKDQFKGERSILSSADDAIPVVKDGNDFAFGPSKGLYVGTGGDLVVRLKGSGTNLRTFKNVPAGSELNIRAIAVDASSTAADILAYI